MPNPISPLPPTPAILVDEFGKNGNIQVVYTNNGKDFTSITPAIVVDINGNPVQ